MRGTRITLLGGAAVVALAVFAAADADADEDDGILLYQRTPARLKIDRQRKAEIQACASCHRDVYEQWKKGPHGHAFKNVVKAFEELMGSVDGLSKRQKKKLIKKHYKSVCVDCHTPNKAVYEDGLDSRWDGGRMPKFEEFEDRSWLTVTTGVDCITCHRSGDRVVTQADYAPPEGFVPPEGFCDPIPSKAFSHIYNCVSCHTDIVEVYAKDFRLDPAQRRGPYLKCETCHMQDGPGGGRTHYYFWGAGEGKIKNMLVPLFDEISLSVRDESGGKRLLIYWETESMPHRFIPHTPKLYVFKLEVLNASEEAVFTTTVRFFDPADDEGRTREVVRSYNTTGELIALPRFETFRRFYDLPDSVGSSGSIRLTILKKSEYKKTDGEADRVYRREEKFSL